MSDADARRLLTEPQLAPSILSADFSRLGEQVELVLDAGTRVIHVDVMDGRFVPPITIGPLIAESIAELVHERGAILDVHMMITQPERQVEAFAAAGADQITIHLEADPHAPRTLAAIRDAGCLAGLALNPGTPAEAGIDLYGGCDTVLCMTVNPGWGGQRFIQASPAKVERLAGLVPEGCVIEVDGGIDASTVAAVAERGASLFVAGSAVYGAADPAAAAREIAAAGAAACNRTAV